MMTAEDQNPAMNQSAQPDDQEQEQEPMQAAEQEETFSEDAREAMADEEAATTAEDFSQLGKEDLYERLKALAQDDSPLRVNRKIQEIKDYFENQVDKEYQQQLQDFLAAGNDEMDFQPKADPLKSDFYKLYRDFKKRRDAQIQKLNEEREQNLKTKRRILDEMKHLTEHLEEEPNSIQRFRKLQDEWRQVGQVPKHEIGNLREAYRFYVNRFYDSQSIYREFKELDRQKNRDRKYQLIEQLEDLAKATDARLIGRETRRLEDEWHRVGPVPESDRETIEHRYQTAMQAAEQQREQLEAAIREQEEQNLAAKWQIVEQIRQFSEFESEQPKEWVTKNEELSGLINQWKGIGYVPKAKKAEVTEAFNEAVKAFNNRKNQFFKRKKKERAQNLQRKREIIEEARKLLEPEDFKAAKEQIFALQREWKSWGRVPGKESDRLWNNFRELCDQFFDNLGAYYQRRDQEEQENLKAKEKLIEQIEQAAQETHEDPEATVQAFQEQWEAIGFVPFKQKDQIQDRYHKAIQALLDHNPSNGSRLDPELQRYKLKLNELRDKGNQNQLKTEERKLNKQLKELSEEITTLEDNMSLFGNTEGAKQLARQYQEKLDSLRKEYQSVNQKLSLLNTST
jgi:hypothetical protein